MDTIDGMRTLVAVADSRSFTAAGRRLGMSTALVSKYVAQLEARLGAALLVRSTRSVTLTEVGRTYLPRCRQLLEDLDALEAAVSERDAAPRGNLVVSAPVTFGEMHLPSVIGRFLDAYPGMSLDLRLTDRFVNVVEEGVDVAVRIAALEDSSLIARRLAPSRILFCASAAYVARHGAPAHPDDLAQHVCIVDTNFRGQDEWPFVVDGKRVIVKVDARLRVNSAAMVRERVLAGAGIALMPSYAIGLDIRRGDAEALLTAYEPPPIGIYAVYPRNRHLAVKTRVFIDWLVAQLGGRPAWERL